MALRGILAEGSKLYVSASERMHAVVAAEAMRTVSQPSARCSSRATARPGRSSMTKRLIAACPDAEALLQAAQPRFLALHEQRWQACS